MVVAGLREVLAALRLAVVRGVVFTVRPVVVLGRRGARGAEGAAAAGASAGVWLSTAGALSTAGVWLSPAGVWFSGVLMSMLRSPRGAAAAGSR